MLRLFLLYALSGFVSLGYQVAWFRIFTDWFGSTNLTFALVVCCFIGGLGLGALWSGPVTDWIGRQLNIGSRLRVYGLVELLVSATALLTLLMALLPADFWGSFPYHLSGSFWIKNLDYQIGQLMVAIICVTVPCLFMGITFPLLCDAFLGIEKASQLPSALYAWNTLGACSGVIACQFFFLPFIGHSYAFLLMVAINASLGLFFLLSGGGAVLATAASLRPAKDEVAIEQAKSGSSAGPSGAASLLIAAAVLSGLVAGALEGDMFKRISLVIANNPGAAMSAISFWAILGIFLGSTAVRVFSTLGLSQIKFAYVLAIVMYWLAWHYGYPVINDIEVELAAIRETQTFEATPPIAMFPNSMSQLFLFVGAYVFPAYFLISFLLPWACNHLQADKKHLGIAYGLNTLAFCIGMIGFTLLAPLVSIFYSLKLIFALLIISALLLQLMDEGRRLALWKPLLAVAAFAGAAFAVPGEFDRSYMNPGLPPATQPVSAMKSNGAVTSFVVTQAGSKVLYFGNVSMTGNTMLGQTYMRLMAHFPLLAQENPTKALLICFGAGNTASAIAAHDTISAIDVVDLNKRVFETAPEFSDTNFEVYKDPRVRLIVDDGRAYLPSSDQLYDLITSEPPPPMNAGVYRLYSYEYYQDVLNHLTPEGMMTQWLPYYQMPPEAVAKAVKSFIAVFPNTMLIAGMGEELILVGGRQPIDLNRIQKRFFEMPEVVNDLDRMLIDEPIDLFARIMQTDSELRENYADAGMISDQNNDLEHLFPGWDRIPVIKYDPLRILGEVAKDSPRIAAEMEPIVTQLGRLHYRIPDFPLYGVEPDSRVKYSDVNWKQVTRLKKHGIEMLSRNDREKAVKAFSDGLKIVPRHGLMLSFIGQMYLENNQPEDAETAFRRLLSDEANDASLYNYLAAALELQGRGQEALEAYRKALSFDADNEDALQGAARILAMHPAEELRDPVEALELAERANALSNGQSPVALRVLGAAYAANRQFDLARQKAGQAIAIARAARDDIVGKAARGDLVLYQQQLAAIDRSLVK